MIRNSDERKEAIDALTTRYVCGEISEMVYMVSLHRHVDVSEIRYLIALNQIAHRSSMAYRRGEVA